MALNLSTFEKKIGYNFKNKDLLFQALTHSSYAYETKREITSNNEVLEFLGDSILGFVMADFLCSSFPKLSEGGLSKLKSAAASTTALSDFAQKIKLNKYIFLGKGEEKSGGRKKISILAGAFEALTAAIYLDGNIENTKDFLHIHMNSFFEKIDVDKYIINNYKSALQEYLQKEYSSAPAYKTLSTRGPDHKKKFIVEVSSNRKKLSKAKGHSKKDAEQKAAQKAMKNLMGKKIKGLTSDTFLLKRKDD